MAEAQQAGLTEGAGGEHGGFDEFWRLSARMRRHRLFLICFPLLGPMLIYAATLSVLPRYKARAVASVGGQSAAVHAIQEGPIGVLQRAAQRGPTRLRRMREAAPTIKPVAQFNYAYRSRSAVKCDRRRPIGGGSNRRRADGTKWTSDPASTSPSTVFDISCQRAYRPGISPPPCRENGHGH